MRKAATPIMPLGIDRFEEIRGGGYYYIDKTNFIVELVEKIFQVQLITRPRRFGKTLTMSMLENFFSLTKDSKKNFEGLAISKREDLCAEWRNQWPTIFLTLKNVNGNTFALAFERFKILISDLCIKHRYLMDSPKVNDIDKILFEKFSNKTANEAETCDAIYCLTRMMNAHYGKQVIVLIDEYDVPLAKAQENGYYKEMLDIIRAMFDKVLKSNEFLKFAVVTGCLKIEKESIFTGTNNFVSNTIHGDRFNEYIGFTREDVQKLLEDTGFENRAQEIKRWYDGFRFGSVDVYCPWDVLSHVNAIQDAADTPPKNYWEDTSHNGILRSFINMANSGAKPEMDVNDKFEILLAGDYIEETIEENLTYDVLYSSEENLWSLLYLTGYLTQVDPVDYKGGRQAEEGKVFLRIPNEEVKSIFKKTVVKWMRDKMVTEDRSQLFQAMWEGDEKKATQFISDYLFNTISYHDYREDFYHAFIAGIFTGAGYIVKSNREQGYGRTDIVVRDRSERRVLILEAKYAKSESRLEAACEEAVKQIDERRYAQEFKKGYRSVICYGIAFHDKQCLVKKFDEIKKD